MSSESILQKTDASLPKMTCITPHDSHSFSTPLISPKQDSLGFHVNESAMNEKQNDQYRLSAVPSLPDMNSQQPKIYDFGALRRESQQTMSSSASPPESINTSATSLGEVRQAERFHSHVPAIFDTIKSINSNKEAGRNYHFNRLQELMKSLEESQEETGKSGSVELTKNTSTSTSSSLSYSRARQSRRSTPNNVTPLKRYDSSKIVRYTLVDKELSPNSGTASNYHQRLNAYDDDDNVTTTNLTSPTTNHSTSKSTFENQINQLPLPPPRPIYDPHTAAELHQPLSPQLLDSTSYYDNNFQNTNVISLQDNNNYATVNINMDDNLNHYVNDVNSNVNNNINETEGGNKKHNHLGSNKSSGNTTTGTENSHYSSVYNHYANQVFEQYNRNLFESIRSNKCHPLSMCAPAPPSNLNACPPSPPPADVLFGYNREKNDPLLYITASPPPPESVFGDKIKYKEKYETVWRPYFTYISTLVMLAYFIVLLAMNSRLTGRVIQLSPFNVMIGPSAQTLVYTGARYLPCIRPSALYPSTANIYQCPYNKATQPTRGPLFNDQSLHFPFHSTDNMFVQAVSVETDFTDNALCQLQDVCGGPHFSDPQRPNQGYRFVSALFMNSGLLQFILNIAVHFKLGGEIEKRIHPLRYSILWLVAGVFGYLFGALFVPENNVSVGCSVAMMGVAAFLFIDLIRNWKCVAQPLKILLFILAYFIITLVIGLLPGYDNFAHLGGFIGGIIVTLIILPTARLPGAVSNKYEYREYSIQIWLLRLLAVAFIAVLFWILAYTIVQQGSGKSCYLCQFFACLPISDLCSPYYTHRMIS